VAWKGTCRRAGISGFTFHDLRREYGSRLVEGGVNLLTVSRLLGHSTEGSTVLLLPSLAIDKRTAAKGLDILARSI
jgi:integrase